jgi:hypothetical protein
MMARSLDNLTNATLQKNDTVKRLVRANKRLAKALADANAAIAQLLLPAPVSAAFGGSGIHPTHWAASPLEWDPQGYCSLHGWKVKRGHSSATCTNRKAGHDTTATRADTKGGSRANKAWTLA